MSDSEGKLARLLKHAWAESEAASAANRPRKPVALFVNGFNFFLEGKKALSSAVNLLLDVNEIKCRVSERVVRDQVTGQVIQLHQLPKNQIQPNSEKAAKLLLNTLQNYPVRDCAMNLPVFGIRFFPYSLEWPIGLVTLYCLPAHSRSTQWRRYIGAREMEMLRIGLDQSAPPGGSEVWAKATIQANENDHDFLRSEGVRIVREALALIALFAITCSEDPALDVYPVATSRHHNYVIELNSGSYWAGVGGGATTLAHIFSVRTSTMTDFTNDGFDSCSRALGVGPNSLQLRVRRSLDYVSLGLRTSDLSERYVMYVTALEALLLKEDERRGISKILRDRVRKLLGARSPDVEKLYDLRSRIVHGGSASVTEIEESIPRIRLTLYSLIKRLLTAPEHFTSLEEFLDHEPERSSSGNVLRKFRELSSTIFHRIRRET